MLTEPSDPAVLPRDVPEGSAPRRGTTVALPCSGPGPAEPVAHRALGERQEPLRWLRNRCGKERAVAMETPPNWESGSFPGKAA